MNKKILSYIDTHYLDPITLDSVANSVGISRFYLSRNFRKLTNCGFCEYLNQKRINEAIILLAETDYSITDVALRSGFQSISSFNRIFKDCIGCSPKEYRNIV